MGLMIGGEVPFTVDQQAAFRAPDLLFICGLQDVVL